MGVDDNFFEVGGNSLLAIRLITELNKEHHIKLSLSQLFENSTPRSLAKVLKTSPDGELHLPIIPIRTSGSKTPLFLIHPVGGLGFPYFSLRYSINDREVYAINNPKFGSKIDNFLTIEEMAASYIKIMTNIQPRGPYIIGGWSFGGVVAIEMAKQLTSIGAEIQKVILIDTYNYSNTREIPSDGIIEDQFKRTLRDESIDLETSEGKLLLQEMCNNYKILLRYVPSSVPIKVALIKATIIPQDATNSMIMDDLFNGWLSIFPQNLSVYSITAMHDNILKSDHIEELSGRLKVILDSLEMDTPTTIVDSIKVTYSSAEKNLDNYVINRLVTDYNHDNFR